MDDGMETIIGRQEPATPKLALREQSVNKIYFE